MSNEQNVLTRFPNLAEALKDLVDEYGLDLVPRSECLRRAREALRS